VLESESKPPRGVAADRSPPAAADGPVDTTGDGAGGGPPPAAAATTVSGWQRWARTVGFVILVVVSAYGIYTFLKGDATAVTSYWSKRYKVLPLVTLFAAMDVSIEMVAWMWVFQRFGLRALDPTGAAVALSGKAGLLLPAQLGRLIRPDLMVRLGRSTLAQALKAEAVVFVLDSTSVLALFAALVAFRVHPALTPVAGLAVIMVTVVLGNRIAKILAGTRLELPSTFWWHWQTVAITVLQSAGWIAHGMAFYVLASDLPGNVTLWDSLFLAPGSAVLGIGSGLPGGIGATEALLGISMQLKHVPQEHLAIGVAAFRIVTFWLLLPVGWMALAYVGRKLRHAAHSGEAVPLVEQTAPHATGAAEPTVTEMSAPPPADPGAP